MVPEQKRLVVRFRYVLGATVLSAAGLLLGFRTPLKEAVMDQKEPVKIVGGVNLVYVHSPHGEQLAKWYQKTLGFGVQSEFPGWTEFAPNGGPRLAVNQTAFPRSVVEKQPIMMSFLVEDIQKAVEQLAAHGVEFYPSKEKAVFDVGPSLVATFADPDGNFLQIHQRKAK
jgi:predicted enzyme related to lactoylglutathione lyase